MRKKVRAFVPSFAFVTAITEFPAGPTFVTVNHEGGRLALRSSA
jgi:hypothetical protein